jgi:DNA-binding Lrp family transcriptional regulator
MTAQPQAPAETLDELDLAIINALQIHPRAPWSLVGEVLEVDPVTASRRWRRMQTAGQAWVTGFLTNGFTQECGAVLEINCHPGQAAEVAETMAADPEAYGIKLMGGRRDLVVLVVARDLAALSAYLLERPVRLPGVASTRTYLMVGDARPSSGWRLRNLQPAARARLGEAASVRQLPPIPLRDVDHALAAALARDGRLGLADLATEMGTSLATARRRMHALLGSGQLTLRCDVARDLSGWPVTAVFWARAPVDALAELNRELAAIPEVRVAFLIAGPQNLYLEAWLRTTSDVVRFEERLTARLPRLTVDDRSITLRVVKHSGRILDVAGRCVGTVPPFSAMPQRR